jgi:peptide subunit release factor 1 (eRF1)
MYADILDSGYLVRQEVTIDMLETGQYRIIKEVHSDVPREHIATLIVEFEILG